MKTVFTIALLAALAVLSGCAAFQKTNAGDAATRLQFSTADGRHVELVLPKNMAAEKLELVAGDYILRADSLKTDASTVMDSAGAANAAQAQSLAEMTKVVGGLVPLAVKAAAESAISMP
ncbi:hypothetical protein Ga0100231_023330 [Opitutaceae bacterium TAV4]|uniref:hypothetical protein n=1 Tax=Geminisphaera colitermitum TaxID=1148786 RepID=UPI000158D10A|nr:hypothetical protein [Geminisphaera colitermitum]RRJ96720.1 hypothetical protein Ga0100231_023330 [Opitutaceae bacterium TAV4]RRK02424.1 hypothetical protein Ga0100230_004575 [Opitutaceae bacterium TAV3]